MPKKPARKVKKKAIKIFHGDKATGTLSRRETLSRTDDPKLLVNASLWKVPGITFKMKNGKKKTAVHLEQCREYAEKHGYDGIQVIFT